jgi:hypothetical protein
LLQALQKSKENHTIKMACHYIDFFSEIVNGHDLVAIGIPNTSISLASSNYTMFDECFPWGPSYLKKVCNH